MCGVKWGKRQSVLLIVVVCLSIQHSRTRLLKDSHWPVLTFRTSPMFLFLYLLFAHFEGRDLLKVPMQEFTCPAIFLETYHGG